MMNEWRMNGERAIIRNMWIDFWRKRNRMICAARNDSHQVRCVRANGHHKRGVRHAFVSKNERIYW